MYNVELEESRTPFTEKSAASPLTGMSESGGAKADIGEATAGNPADVPDVGNRDIHRMGGASVGNLRLKPREATLDLPGISVLKSPTPGEAARQMRTAFPKAKDLHEAAKTVGSTTEALIRSTGFDIIHVPSKVLPNHYRIIHTDGVAGFEDEHLARLAQAFVNTTGHTS